MFPYLVPIFLLSVLSKVQSSDGNPITNEVLSNQQLMFTIAVNRHGERAPDAEELSLSDQPAKITNLTKVEGPEGLMIIGKKRAYQLGKFFRQRYGDKGLTSDLYLRDEIAIRSTDKERTKMTIQLAMAAMYPPEPVQQWDDALGKVWQPVPYTAVPLSEDYLRYYSNCDKYMSLMEEAQHASIMEEFQPFMDLIPLLKEKTGFNFTESPLLFQSLFDLFRSTVGLGLKIPEWAQARDIQARLEEAARLAYRLYFRGEEMKKIGGGVLLDKFLNAAEDLIAGVPVSQRLRLFSSHDFNVGALMEVSRVKGPCGIPDYTSMFALELYRSRSTGEYSVLPIYLPKAGGTSSVKELRIAGCGNKKYCNFAKFKELVKEYRLPEKEFYKICNIRTELGCDMC